MSRRTVIVGLVFTMVVQLCLLLGMLASASMPLWRGQEIRVKTVPVDPRSLFRGNYARLRYDFSRLPEGSIDDHAIRNNEPVFVSLMPAENGLYQLVSASLQKPQEGVFIKGRLQGKYRRLDARYGIEAWFAPKSDALQLEKDLRDGGVAVLMIDSNGKAALKAILPLE